MKLYKNFHRWKLKRWKNFYEFRVTAARKYRRWNYERLILAIPTVKVKDNKRAWYMRTRKRNKIKDRQTVEEQIDFVD